MDRLTFLKGAGLASLAVLAGSAAVTATATDAEASPYGKYGPYSHGTILPSGKGIVERGCVIRFTASGPKIHVNGAHQSIGVIPNSIHINAQGNLVFRLDIGLPVITTSISPDETLVADLIHGGLSGGANECVVWFADKNGRLNLNNPAHYARISGPVSNVWISVKSYYAG